MAIFEMLTVLRKDGSTIHRAKAHKMQHAKEDVVFVLRQLIKVANTDHRSFSEIDARIFLKAARTILVRAIEDGYVKIDELEQIEYIDSVLASQNRLHHVDVRHAVLAAIPQLRSVVAKR